MAATMTTPTITAEQSERLLALIGEAEDAMFQYGSAAQSGDGVRAAGDAQRAAHSHLAEYVISHLQFGFPAKDTAP